MTKGLFNCTGERQQIYEALDKVFRLSTSWSPKWNYKGCISVIERSDNRLFVLPDLDIAGGLDLPSTIDISLAKVF